MVFVQSQTNSFGRLLIIRMNLDLTSASRNEWESVRVCIYGDSNLHFFWIGWLFQMCIPADADSNRPIPIPNVTCSADF